MTKFFLFDKILNFFFFNKTKESIINNPYRTNEFGIQKSKVKLPLKVKNAEIFWVNDFFDQLANKPTGTKSIKTWFKIKPEYLDDFYNELTDRDKELFRNKKEIELKRYLNMKKYLEGY